MSSNVANVVDATVNSKSTSKSNFAGSTTNGGIDDTPDIESSNPNDNSTIVASKLLTYYNVRTTKKNSLLRSSISINSIRRSALQFTKSLDRSNIIAKDIIKTTKDKNLFDRKTISKDNEYFRKRRENVRRKQREDELEASSITGVTKREGTVSAKSTKGFLGRILDFFGIILIGWFVTKLPGLIKAIGNVINADKKQ